MVVHLHNESWSWSVTVQWLHLAIRPVSAYADSCTCIYPLSGPRSEFIEHLAVARGYLWYYEFVALRLLSSLM